MDEVSSFLLTLHAGCCVDCTDMSRLSLVAEFDELVRCRAVLSAGIETGSHDYLAFVTAEYYINIVCW